MMRKIELIYDTADANFRIDTKLVTEPWLYQVLPENWNNGALKRIIIIIIINVLNIYFSGANLGSRHDLNCPYRGCPRPSIKWIKVN